MINILSKIADSYTDEPDAKPELTFAHFVSEMFENFRHAALAKAEHDPMWPGASDRI